MRLAALFTLLLVAGLHAQNIAIVQVGQLNPCAARIMTFNTVQTWCYAPGMVLVSNHLVTVYNSTVDPYDWCAGNLTIDLPAPMPNGCTPSTVTWQFSINPNGAGINFAVAGTGIVGEIKGTLTLLPAVPSPPPGKVALQGNLSTDTSGKLVAIVPWSGWAVTSIGTWPAIIEGQVATCKNGMPQGLTGGNTIEWFELPVKAPTTTPRRSANVTAVVNASVSYITPVCH